MAEETPPARAVVCAADAGTRLAAARAWLGAAHGRRAVVLAPTRGAADELLRDACPAGGGLLGVDRLTVHQLAGELAADALAAEGLAPVAGLGLEALAARAVARCWQRRALDYFAPVARLPGFARALAKTLGDLRVNAIAAEALRGASDAEDVSGLDVGGASRRELADLLEAYEDELARWRLVDAAGLYRHARAALRSDAAATGRHWRRRPLLLLDLAPAGRLQRAFLAALAAQAPAGLATALDADRDAREALETIVAAPCRGEGGIDAAPAGNRLERLRRDVFRTEIPPLPEAADRDDPSLAFFGAAGEGRECVEIARRIRDLAADGGDHEPLPFDRIAVLLRDPTSYLPLIEEALRRAEIPAFFSRGTVRPHPAGRAFLALLACAAERLSASRFAEYLSLGETPQPDADGAPPAAEVPWVEAAGDQLVLTSPAAAETAAAEPLGDGLDASAGAELAGEGLERPVVAGTLRTPRKWERLLVDAAVVGGGPERWRQRLRGLENELVLRRQALDGEDEAAERRLDDDLALLRHLRRFALPVVEQLAALPESAPWGAWLEALEALAARVLRQPQQVLAMLAELRPMAEVGPVSLDEVRRTLEPRLGLLRAEPPPRRYGRVFVATLEEARGHAFDAVFVPGMAEGIFPRRVWEDPLLLDDARRALARALPTRGDQVEGERLLLRIAAGAARERLVISYPNLDTLQGRARVPSFYALDVLRAAEGALPDLGRLESRAAAETDSILGWPAPRDPARAIDDAEYDLAVLEPLLRRSRAETRGRGRYLLESNEHLDRALRARWRRWRPAFSSADGLVDPDDETRAALAAHRLRARSYSPTALQRYAECPYRFLLHAVHRLRPREEAIALEQLDPLTRGKLFHQVQQELLSTLRDEGLLPFDLEGLGMVLERADAVLDRVAAAYREQLAPAIERVWSSEIEGLRTDLHGWLRTVAADLEPWVPSHFELAFGLDRGDRDPASQADAATVLDGVGLRGSIDLVERDEKRAVLRVTDHKTGLPYRRAEVVVGGGEVLQPLLYALAAEQVLGEPVEAGRLSYCTRRGRFESRQVAADDANRQRVAAVLEVVDDALAEGFLPAAPRQRACRWCDYAVVCGPNEEQRLELKIGRTDAAPSPAQHKSRKRLAKLLELRRQP